MGAEYEAEIERCNREIAWCEAYEGPDKFGALWGELDWRVEREILRQERDVVLKPYYEEDGITIYNGDARLLLPQLPDSSVDFIFSDPPYGHNNNNGDLIHRREVALGHGAAGEARHLPTTALKRTRLSSGLSRNGGGF